MLSMIQAHGLEAGPTQRPMLAGLIAGLISSGPAAALMWALGTLHAISADMQPASIRSFQHQQPLPIIKLIKDITRGIGQYTQVKR